MNFGQTQYYVLKMLCLMVILVEAAVVRMIILPKSFYEYIVTQASIWTYTEHIILSIVFLSLGALIYMKQS